MRRDLMPFPNRQDNLEYTQEDVILIAETFAKEHLKEQLLIQRVSQQRELLIDFLDKLENTQDEEIPTNTYEEIADKYLQGNL